MSHCSDCEHARQTAKKSCQNRVGCVMLGQEKITIHDVKNSELYEGYIYYGRRVGDISESKALGKGALTLGIITESKGTCKSFAPR